MYSAMVVLSKVPSTHENISYLDLAVSTSKTTEDYNLILQYLNLFQYENKPSFLTDRCDSEWFLEDTFLQLVEQFETLTLTSKNPLQILKYLEFCRKVKCVCHSSSQADRIFQNVFKVLITDHYTDTSLFASLLETTYHLISSEDWIFLSEDSQRLEYFLYHWSRIRTNMELNFDLKRIRPNSYLLNTPEPLSKMYDKGLHTNLKVFLNYGYTDRYSDEVFHWYEILCLMTMYNVGTAIHLQIRQHHNFEKVKRTFYIYELVAVFALEQVNKRQNIEEVLNVWWRSMPDAFITELEIRQELKKMARNSSRQQFIETICNRVRNSWYEGSTLPTGPRTLQHYCRCTLRQQLTKSFRLPDGVVELGLPEKLQRYLLLEF